MKKDSYKHYLQEYREQKKTKREVFFRYTKKLLSDKEIWDVYNLTRDVKLCLDI